MYILAETFKDTGVVRVVDTVDDKVDNIALLSVADFIKGGTLTIVGIARTEEECKGNATYLADYDLWLDIDGAKEAYEKYKEEKSASRGEF